MRSQRDAFEIVGTASQEQFSDQGASRNLVALAVIELESANGKCTDDFIDEFLQYLFTSSNSLKVKNGQLLTDKELARIIRNYNLNKPRNMQLPDNLEKSSKEELSIWLDLVNAAIKERKAGP